MSRDVLPIVGSAVGGFFGPRLSWWRRALIWLAHAGLPKPKGWVERESPELFYAGGRVCGEAVDPVREFQVFGGCYSPRPGPANAATPPRKP